MRYRTLIKYTAEQKAEMRDRWQRGDSVIPRIIEVLKGKIFAKLK